MEEYQNTAFASKDKYDILEYSRLQRMYNINEQFYNKLIDKKAEYQISKAGYVSEIVTLDISSVPKDPIYSKKTIDLFRKYFCGILAKSGVDYIQICIL